MINGPRGLQRLLSRWFKRYSGFQTQAHRQGSPYEEQICCNSLQPDHLQARQSMSGAPLQAPACGQQELGQGLQGLQG